VVGMFVTLFGSIILGVEPLNAVQLLWINLILDAFGALALSTDPPTPELLNRPPNKRNAPLMTRQMTIFMITQSLYQIALLMFILVYGFRLWSINDENDPTQIKRNTVVFTTFVMLNIFHQINCRHLTYVANPFKGITKNYYFLGITLLTLLIQFIMTQYGGDFTRTYPLTFEQWMISLAFGLTSLPAGMLNNLYFNRRELYNKRFVSSGHHILNIKHDN
jgi:magnesium-transporting ATPase (P-type)